MTHDVHRASFEIVLACALIVIGAFAWPRRRLSRNDVLTAMQAVVLRVEEDGRTRTVRAPVPITIGRAPSATLVVSDAQVSRVHARIDVLDGLLSVRDLDSRNGTFVNARPIDGPVPLGEGDEIDVGTIRIVMTGVGPWK